MQTLMEEEDEVLEVAIREMAKMPEILVYGGTDLKACPRAASISFNIRGIDHGLVAAQLNDYFNIAVRNQCFCAHPYVKEMMSDDLESEFGEIDFGNMSPEFMRKAGMVRASFGLYSTLEDVALLIAALKDIIQNGETYGQAYELNSENDYVNTSYRIDKEEIFNIVGAIDQYIGD